MGLLLISESTIETEKEVIQEENGKSKYYLKGITIQGGIKNRNGREYPLPVLESEVARYSRDKIARHMSWGELDHPDKAKINMDRVSHMFTELKQEGKNFVGKAIILDNPMGNIVRSLLDVGTVGLSSRALGSLKEQNGVQIVQGDLFIVTPGDIVSDPSAPEAFVRGLKEGVEYEWLDDSLVERVISNINRNYKSTMSVENKKQVLMNEFTALINALRRI